MPPFSPSHEDLRVRVDLVLERFLSERAAALEDNRPLIGELARLIRAGGKRLRPLFCYWGARAAGAPDSEPLVRAAASLELLHTFALVHDDIMDASIERRGQPAVHVLRGVSVGILAGDLALALADSCLFASGIDIDVLGRALPSYLLMREEVIAGQYLDVVAAAGEELDEAEARRIALLKSGRYSIEKPLVMGARLGGASDDLAGALSAFGEPLGEAFQFRDDLLGTFGTSGTTGKPTDSDVREGKRNLLYARTAGGLRGARRRRFVALWGGGPGLSAADVAEARSLIEFAGARAHVETLVDDLAARALTALATANLAPEPHAALAVLADLSVNRDL